MHRLVGFTLSLAVCRSEAGPAIEAAAAATPSPVAPAARDPAAPVALNLPRAPEPRRSADGAPPAPDVYRLPDGRSLLHDTYRDRVAVRDPTTGRDIDLGEAYLVAVPRLGWLIVPRSGDPLRYHDVDPAAPRLRLLWAAPVVAEQPDVVLDVALAGLDRGAPLFLIRRHRYTAGQPARITLPTAQLVRVTGPDRAETRTLELRADLDIPGNDALRGRRLLLVGPERDAPPPVAPTAWAGSFTAPVFLLDLDTEQLRRLGDASGALTRTTAAPHRYVAVRWTDHDPHARDRGWAEDCINLVAPTDERLTGCIPLPWP